jgi:hypothetical protein
MGMYPRFEVSDAAGVEVFECPSLGRNRDLVGLDDVGGVGSALLRLRESRVLVGFVCTESDR